MALVTFALRTYINTGTGVFVGGILILTTIFLSFIFIPKASSTHFISFKVSCTLIMAEVDLKDACTMYLELKLRLFHYYALREHQQYGIGIIYLHACTHSLFVKYVYIVA